MTSDAGDRQHDHAEQEERVVAGGTSSGRRDVDAGSAPPLTQPSGTRMLSNISANAKRGEREEDAAEPQRRDREQRADRGGEHRADEHRQEHRQARTRATSCAVANPPTAANVAWHSEIWPAMPVITVIERKITPKTTALVTISEPEGVEREQADEERTEHDDRDAERRTWRW